MDHVPTPATAAAAASAHGTLAHLIPPTSLRTQVASWLAEDCPSFDGGGFVVGATPQRARLLCKSPGVLAGLPFATEVFRQLDCTVDWHVAEGTPLAGSPPTHVATVRGPARQVLLGERVALNILARCSGIATATARAVARLQAHTTATTSRPPRLAGTRKTTPGFRLVEKYGMLVGGADPHRMDLASMTMLKDNHVWACGGSIAQAVAAAKAVGGFALKVEVECRDVAEARQAVAAGAEVVMLDNFTPEEAAEAAKTLRTEFAGRAFLLEISGGLTEETLPKYAAAGVDVLSTSSIHQGVPHVDFSLKIVRGDTAA